MELILKLVIGAVLWLISFFVSSMIYNLVKIDRVFFGYIIGAAFVISLLALLVSVFGELALQRYFLIYYVMVAVGGYNGYVSNFFIEKT